MSIIQSPIAQNAEIIWEPGVEEAFSASDLERAASVVKLESVPDHLSGQRSSILTLSDVVGEATGIQAKGHFWRPDTDTSQMSPPEMIIYVGRGHPELGLYARENGNIVVRATSDVSRGAILEKLAQGEIARLRDMHSDGLPIVRPLGLAHLTDYTFSVGCSLQAQPDQLSRILQEERRYEDQGYLDEVHQTYALVIGTPRSDAKRFTDTITELGQTSTSKSNTRKLLRGAFTALGETVAEFLDKGYLLGNPHIENFSIVETSESGAGTFSFQGQNYKIFAHDPGLNGEEKYRKDQMSDPQWKGYVLLDIANTTIALVNFTMSYYQFKQALDETQNPSLKMIDPLMKMADNTGVDPTVPYLTALLGDHAHMPLQMMKAFATAQPLMKSRMIMLGDYLKDQVLDLGLERSQNEGLALSYLGRRHPLVGAVLNRF